MSRRKRHAPDPENPAVAPAHPADGARQWMLAAAIGLLVARPLVPPEMLEESAAGLTFTMGWLLLAAAWPLTGLVRGGLPVRFGKTEMAVVVWMAALAVSGLAAIADGAPRAAINATWQWMTAGVAYLLIRQLVWTSREARAIVVVTIGLAAALSVYGLYQFAVELPEMREQYAADPQLVLGQQGIEAGSTAHRRLEDRIASTEPFATFALTNSLAGFLVAWLTVAVGLALAAYGWREKRRLPVVIGAVLCTLLIAACLLLTKSRSGYLAAGVGVLAASFVVGAARTGRRRRRALIWGLCVAVLAVLIAAAVFAGGLDAQVIVEAGKSLGYRWQYWQATLAMIADHPVFGCGPGQFQDAYTQYKLPDAAEEVADPHNFVLEIAATGGTAALLAMFAAMGCFGWEIWKRRPRDEEADDPPGVTDSVFHVLTGAVVGMLASAPLCLIAIAAVKSTALIIALCVVAAAAALLFAWIRAGQLPRGLPAVAALALLVNLLAAGGIGIPAVSNSLWLLAALALWNNHHATRRDDVSRRAAGWLAAVCGLLIVMCLYSAYIPVLGSRTAAALARQARSNAEIESHLLAAAAADSLAAGPQRALAGWYFARWQQRPSDELFALFDAADSRGLQLSPNSSSAWRQTGEWFRTAHEVTGKPEHLERAVAAYRRAVEQYPHNATRRAELALALHAAGDAQSAAAQTEDAVRLDSLTPHADQKLPDELRRQIERINGGG